MGKFQQYKINLATLQEGLHTKDMVCDTELFRNMENNDVLESDVKVHLNLTYRNGIYDCLFTLKGEIKIPCNRCLDPMAHEIDTTYHVKVKYGEEYDDSNDEVLVIPDTDAFLNVAYMLYDTIVLTIPIRHVHPQGQCNRAMADVLQKHRMRHDEDDDLDADEGMDEQIDIPND